MNSNATFNSLRGAKKRMFSFLNIQLQNGTTSSMLTKEAPCQDLPSFMLPTFFQENLSVSNLNTSSNLEPL